MTPAVELLACRWFCCDGRLPRCHHGRGSRDATGLHPTPHLPTRVYCRQHTRFRRGALAALPAGSVGLFYRTKFSRTVRLRCWRGTVCLMHARRSWRWFIHHPYSQRAGPAVRASTFVLGSGPVRACATVAPVCTFSGPHTPYLVCLAYLATLTHRTRAPRAQHLRITRHPRARISQTSLAERCRTVEWA